MIGRPDWWDHAACHNIPTRLFYLSSVPNRCRLACHTCPVRTRCLEEALIEDAQVGAWRRCGFRGGHTARERTEMIRARGIEPDKRPPPPGHGTDSAYMRHRRNGTEPCDDCRAAHATAAAERKARRNRGAA